MKLLRKWHCKQYKAIHNSAIKPFKDNPHTIIIALWLENDPRNKMQITIPYKHNEQYSKFAENLIHSNWLRLSRKCGKMINPRNIYIRKTYPIAK